MYRFFSLNGCFRFLISQAYILSVLMELDDDCFQLSYSISICSLQHLIGKRFLYRRKCLQCTSVQLISMCSTIRFEKVNRKCAFITILSKQLSHYPEIPFTSYSMVIFNMQSQCKIPILQHHPVQSSSQRSSSVSVIKNKNFSDSAEVWH